MACCARTEEQRSALRDQVHAILGGARREIPNHADLQDVEQHGLQALDELQTCKSKDQPRLYAVLEAVLLTPGD